jgi:hypothetical protein
MTRSNDEQLPKDLREVVEELRAHRAEASALELDGIKRKAMVQASRASGSPPGQGLAIRSKILTLALVLGLAVSAGAAGVLAGGGGSTGGSSAAKSEYRPGKGCDAPPPSPRRPPNKPPVECPPPP